MGEIRVQLLFVLSRLGLRTSSVLKPNSESSDGVHSRFVFPMLLNPEPYFPFVFIHGYPALLAPFLDQLDFVPCGPSIKAMTLPEPVWLGRLERG
jgi:hypothetical protein